MPTTTTVMTSASEESPSKDLTNLEAKEPHNNHQQEQEQQRTNDEIGACDDLGSSDEVKVFNDEDERDGDVTESYQAELQAEKTSLIHESEQVLLLQLRIAADPPLHIIEIKRRVTNGGCKHPLEAIIHVDFFFCFADQSHFFGYIKFRGRQLRQGPDLSSRGPSSRYDYLLNYILVNSM